MEKKIAGLISYIFHPLLIPTYLILFFLNFPAFIFFEYNFKLKLILTSYVFLLTFIVPAVVLFFMKKNRIIQSYKMDTRQERVLPLVFMSIIYYTTYYFINQLGILNIYSVFLLGTTLLTLFTLLINFYTKISLHMIGAGSVTGILTGLIFNFPEINIIVLYSIIILSGIIAYSRYYLTNHSIRQLFYGYLLGFFVMFFIIIFY